MKIIVWLLATTILVNCTDSGDSKKGRDETTVISKEKAGKNLPDSLRVLKLYSSVEDKVSSLMLRNDTVYVFIKSKPAVPFQGKSRFCYDSLNGRFNYISDQSNPVMYDTVLPVGKGRSASLPFYFEKISNPEIKYSNYNPDLAKSIKPTRPIDGQVRLQSFGSKIYGIQKEFASGILMYDSLTKKTNELKFGSTFHEVTDYFLYDLDKDGDPEVFIFNIGIVPREDVVSFDVYSIRQDSVKINFIR